MNNSDHVTLDDLARITRRRRWLSAFNDAAWLFFAALVVGSFIGILILFGLVIRSTM